AAPGRLRAWCRPRARRRWRRSRRCRARSCESSTASQPRQRLWSRHRTFVRLLEAGRRDVNCLTKANCEADRLQQGVVMRENLLRSLWKSGGAAVNGWLAIPNSFSAETMAHQGWDSLTIDLQHGVVDYQAMLPMLQAISTTDTVPVVRVPWL